MKTCAVTALRFLFCEEGNGKSKPKARAGNSAARTKTLGCLTIWVGSGMPYALCATLAGSAGCSGASGAVTSATGSGSQIGLATGMSAHCIFR